MNRRGKKRKIGATIVPGSDNPNGRPSNNDTATPSQISRALHTHTVCHWGLKSNGAVTYHRSSTVIAPSAGFQVANLGLGRDWYASLFRQPTTVEKGPDQSVNDINGPISDEQAVIPARRTRVSSPHYQARSM